MAVIRIDNPVRYTAAAGDTLPTTGVPAGSEAFVFDGSTPPNISRYIYNGTAWCLFVTKTEAIGA